jgi:hypothetical protein
MAADDSRDRDPLADTEIMYPALAPATADERRDDDDPPVRVILTVPHAPRPGWR